MCPACVSTLALIAAGAGSAGGLATVVVRKVRKKPAAQPASHDAPARPANEEDVR
jgi:hypothetical protein